jgi:serine/threonine protein kinase
VAHADVQPKQFLVSRNNRSNNQHNHLNVKLNDFNRCRFVLARNDSSSVEAETSCPFIIPSSPGASRSPEEYSKTTKNLTVAIDMYSFGHVIYGILTGKDIDIFDTTHPQYEKLISALTPSTYRERVARGEHPTINKDTFRSEGAGDDVLLQLLDQVYKLNPKERATSRQVREKLERVHEQLLSEQILLGRL